MAPTPLGIIIVLLIFFAIGIALMVVIMRAVFMIPTIVKNLTRQTELLEEILKNQREK